MENRTDRGFPQRPHASSIGRRRKKSPYGNRLTHEIPDSPLDPRDPLTTLTERINGAAIAVHRRLGPGLLESAYQACLEYELALQRISFERQVSVPVVYRGVQIDCGYRLDLLVEGRVVVEVKSVERLAPIHSAQMITYLKLRQCPVGLVLNFNVTSMRQGIRRLENRFLNSTVSESCDLTIDETPPDPC